MLTEQVYANETISTAENTGWKLVCLSKCFLLMTLHGKEFVAKLVYKLPEFLKPLAGFFLPRKLVFELKAF